MCESARRFLLLFTFLKKNLNKKVIVFFSSCNSVKFHSELLNYVDLPVLDLHGDQKQNKRTATFFDFCSATTGTLLCTDVAARGLDISDIKAKLYQVKSAFNGLLFTSRALSNSFASSRWDRLEPCPTYAASS